MIAFVAIVVTVGLAHPSPVKPLANRLPVPSRPLWKPEPGLILSRTGLSLTQAQRSSIETLNAKWEADKSELLKAMGAYVPKQSRIDQMKGSLEGYSELSRTYEAARAQYWTQACALLDERQKALVTGGPK